MKRDPLKRAIALSQRRMANMPITPTPEELFVSAQSQDARKNLPDGMNAVDMDSRGSRFALMSWYGDVTGDQQKDDQLIKRIVNAWGAVNWLDTDVLEGHGKRGVVSRDTSRRFMLKFADGKWRRASFGGINGPPCAHCAEVSYAAVNGKVAYYTMLMAQAQENLERAMRNLTDARDQVVALSERLNMAEKEGTE